jgi:hypothetical protein
MFGRDDTMHSTLCIDPDTSFQSSLVLYERGCHVLDTLGNDRAQGVNVGYDCQKALGAYSSILGVESVFI